MLSLIFLLLISCSSTDEQRNTVGMRLLGEASEIETSLSGDPIGTQSSMESTTSTAPSSDLFSEVTTTSVVRVVFLARNKNYSSCRGNERAIDQAAGSLSS